MKKIEGENYISRRKFIGVSATGSVALAFVPCFTLRGWEVAVVNPMVKVFPDTFPQNSGP